MTVLYIGNHTSSSKGYAAMARQIIKNEGNTFVIFLQEIPEEVKQKPLMKQIFRIFLYLHRKIILERSLRMHHIR